MNPYGDPQTPRARAQVPGAPGGPAPDDYSDRGAARPAPDAYRRGGSGGRASVGGSSGSAAVGGAAVGGASVGSARPGGRAVVGGAPAGSASVGTARPGGRASVGAAPVGTARPGGGGRASVGAAAVGGRASVGGPGGTPPGTGDEGAIGAGGGNRKNKSKAAKRRRRVNILTAAAAVVVIMLGGGVVAGTYFFDSVELPPPVTEDQSNVILESNGAVLAKIGDQNRTVVPEEKINKVVEHAVAAAEDKNYYTHHGIDTKGILRAAFNNFTGGDTQGASTITQQYARHVADLKSISYSRKLREAVIARKLDSKYSKDQVMGMYLNYIDLGRGLYGIEAAAQGYFGKSVTTPAGQKNAITPYEAAVLAGIIKQPYANGASKGYDPANSLENAKGRWEYTMKNMLDMGWITPAEYANRKFPTVKPKASNTTSKTSSDKPLGLITRHVKAELAAAGIDDQKFEQGGLTITTTIDPAVQKAAEAAGMRSSKDSPMHDLPASYQAAVIGIDPNTGRVLGYYGGDEPEGTDYAGGLNGTGTQYITGQSPGSSFKIYTLAAGLAQGLSFDSTWDASVKAPDGRTISNAGADPGKLCSGKASYCDLETATIRSYNFPFVGIANAIGVDKVIDAAKQAGIKHMWTNDTKLINLDTADASTIKNAFDYEVAYGQYRIEPLEHAEGVATVVNQGVHHAAHFIKSVTQIDADSGKKNTLLTEKLDGNRVFAADTMSNLAGVMKQVVTRDKASLRSGRESIAKSGTWEYNETEKGSGDCWFVGGIPQLAATVWVGTKQHSSLLKEANGDDMFGAGTPADIWKQFINAVTDAMNMKNTDFPDRQKTGDPSKFGNGTKPKDQPQTDQPQTDQNQSGVCLFGVVGAGCTGGGTTSGNTGGGTGNTGGTGTGGTGNTGGTGTGGTGTGGTGTGGTGTGGTGTGGTGTGTGNGDGTGTGTGDGTGTGTGDGGGTGNGGGN